MHKDDLKTDEQRRKLVKLAAGAAVVLPLGGLAACSGGDSDESAASKAEEAATAAKEKASEAADKVADGAGEMMDDASEMAGEAKDTMAQAADDAGEAMGEMADKADAAMQDASDKAGEMASEAKDKADSMVSDAKDAVSGKAGGLPKLKEDDAVAQALGYKHDASKIDAAKYPGRGAEANEYCKNCSLFVAGGDGWGACSIFAGKAVNANGWCASYNRKSA